MYFLTKNILQEVYRCYPFIFIFYEFYKHFLRKIKIKIIMNTKQLLLYLNPYDEYDSVIIHETTEINEDNCNQDGIKFCIEHTSEPEKTRDIKLYPEIEIDKENLIYGKLNGFVSNSKGVVEEKNYSGYSIEMIRTYLKSEITVYFDKTKDEFNQLGYKEQPGVIVNIEKKFESLYSTYSTEYIKNEVGRYIGVKITFNSLKYKTNYPVISIIIVGDKTNKPFFVDYGKLGSKNTNWENYANRLKVKTDINGTTLNSNASANGYYLVNADDKFVFTNYRCEFDMVSTSETSSSVKWYHKNETEGNQNVCALNTDGYYKKDEINHYKLICQNNQLELFINDILKGTFNISVPSPVEIGFRINSGEGHYIKYKNFVIYKLEE